MPTALTAARALTPHEEIADAVVLIEDGVIRAAGPRTTVDLPRNCELVDFGENVLAPGYVDLHIHGAAGHDVMRADDTAMAQIETLLAEHGVTTWCPTTVTAPLDVTLRALEKLAAWIERSEQSPAPDQAQAIGIHLEGPFISHVKRGVHPSADILEPTPELFDRFWQAARGRIRVMTIAPEINGAEIVIAEAARRDVCVSLGHSNAELAPTRAAIAAGARHVTHTFNAMRGLDHRDPGILGAALADSRLTADIIADGVHLDPVVVELFLKTKGAEGAVLITDATSATAMPDGRYQLGSFTVEVQGLRCVSAEGKLAGSVLTMDRAVRNVMDFAGWDLAPAARLASLNPARVLGLGAKGALAPGADADIVVLSPAGEVVETITRGQGT